MSEIPNIELYDALRPTPALAALPVLDYKNLEADTAEHIQYDAQRWQRFEEADGFAEDKAALGLAKQYLIQTALEATTAADPISRELWAQRFTEASRDMFGEPDPKVARSLHAAQYQEIAGYQDNSKVSQSKVDWLLDRYNKLGISDDAELSAEQIELVRKSSNILGEAAVARFGEALAVFDGVDDTLLTPPRIADLFNQGLQVMGYTHDPVWHKWQAVLVDSTNLEAKNKQQRIHIGERRQPMRPAKARALFGHEVLWHALCHQNGQQLAQGDKVMEKGLPGYYVADEGGAMLLQYGLAEEVPLTSGDRYGDIAMALGIATARALSRPELFVLMSARDIIRMQAKRSDEEIAKDADGTKQQDKAQQVQKAALSKVNRIYRGSRGDRHIGVFTKDIIYYQGQALLAPYIVNGLQNGQSPAELFDYITQAKFDPTNAEHRAYIANLRSSVDQQG